MNRAHFSSPSEFFAASSSSTNGWQSRLNLILRIFQPTGMKINKNNEMNR